MFRIGDRLQFVAIAAALLMAARAAPTTGQQIKTDDPITLELIMGDPDWIGNPPENPYWADDGKSFYYFQKRVGQERRDLVQMDLKGKVLRVVADEDRGRVDVAGGRFDENRTQKVYAHHDDVFLKDPASGAIRQLTRTAAIESDPRFTSDGKRVFFRRDGATFIRELNSGLEYEPADLHLEDDPDKKKDEKFDYLKEQQERLFEHIRKNKAKQEQEKKEDREAQRADATQTPLPIYLGKDMEIRGRSLSPNGQWMLLRLAKKKPDIGKRDAMPNYVTDSGYVTTQPVRSKVGTGKPTGETLVLLDLRAQTKHEIDLSVLPGIEDDPLRALREAAEEARKAAEKKKKDDEDAGEDKEETDEDASEEEKDTPKKESKSRRVEIRNIVWTEDGGRVALQCFSIDRKDRWIATIDLEEKKLVPLERMSDEAWINRRFAGMGWLRDGRTLYFQSEEDGYCHIYLRSPVDGSRRQLTKGAYEATSLRLDRDGRYLYFLANIDHPGVYEVHRADVGNDRIERLTDIGGRNRFILSPDERHLLILHSTTARPSEIHVQRNEPDAKAERMTRTISEQFTSLPWVKPRIVTVPSRTGRPIYSRLYLPNDPGGSAEAALRPAVVFIHGAGYLQNAHAGWSYYFHEFMFHTLLTRRGYVVLDMDYRASAGYGRDWRTAIYRRMGTPEVEDLADGVAWLVENHEVDAKRIGVYGGSYGGFLTFMAMFRKPDLFACGASLRPVTDWAHYNHRYTANILNTPTIDPEGYERSSPIEFAEGLAKPLLICHGMQDDNVFFEDTVRLVQRLIELKKENWEVAIYPIEPHSFRRPESWLDEYRRILKLFETNLRSSRR